MASEVPDLQILPAPVPPVWQVTTIMAKDPADQRPLQLPEGWEPIGAGFVPFQHQSLNPFQAPGQVGLAPVWFVRRRVG